MNEWQDIDKEETREWQDAILAVIAEEGPERAHFLLENLIDQARRNGAHLPYSANTAYVNSIPPMAQKPMPGNAEYEHKIRSYVRWNALAMVVRANRKPGDLGGHIASFASAAVLYDVGFNHFFRGKLQDAPADTKEYGDLVYFQGHSAPGVYARVFGGTNQRRANGKLPLGNKRQGIIVLSASMADARFLAIPHGIHGLGADYGDLSSAFYALFGKSRLNTQNEPQSVGVHGGRRNGRAGIFGGYIAGGTRGAG